MRRHLLIDLDGVLRRWDPRLTAALEERHGLPSGSLASAAFGATSLLHRAVTGEITDAEWRVSVVQRLQPLCGGLAETVVAEWSDSPGEVDSEVLAVLREARAVGWRVGLLTNATTRLAEDLRRLGLDREVDVVINSSATGLVKPSPGAYRHGCAVIGATPNLCVLVDDTVENVRAAGLLGMIAHVFQSASALRDVLVAESHSG